MVADTAGNVYVTGATFDPDNLNAGYIGNNILTIKYDASGSERWRAYATGRAFALAIDKTGNVYVTGDHASNPHDLYETRDYQTIKYSSDGTEQWRARTDGTANENDVARALAVDASGNVYVTGSSNSYYAFPDSGSDLLTVKYNSSGVEQWRVTAPKAIGTDGYGAAIAVDGSGNAYVAGLIFRFNSSQYVTIKYSATGTEQWRALIDSSGDINHRQYAPALALDGSGNVYVAGTGGSLSNSSYLTVKYATNGVEQWRAFVDGGTNPALNVVRALAVDTAGNAYIAGQNGQYVDSYTYLYDTLTVKYAPNGSEFWRAPGNLASNPYTSSADAVALAVDTGDNVYVAAKAGSVFGQDIVTIKYDSIGTERWRAAAGSASASPSGLGLDGGGNVYVAGVTRGVREDFLTVKYDAAGFEQWRESEGLAIPPVYFGGTPIVDKHALAINQTGDVHVIGQTYVDPYARHSTLTLKIDSNGSELWRATAGDATWTSVAVDVGSNVYVTGWNNDTWPVEQYLTVKYDSSGIERWRAYANNGSSYESDLATAVVVDVAGNVYVTGISTSPQSAAAYLTVKYDANGLEQWRAMDMTCVYCRPHGLAVDPNGNVYVAGSFTSDDINHSFVTIKYGPNGAMLWRAATSSNTLYPAGAYALAIDGVGNVYVTGSGIKPGTQHDDFLTVKFDPNGNQQWQIYGNVGPAPPFTNSYDVVTGAYDLKLDADNNVYVTGRRSNGKNFDYATIKYDTNGVEQWHAIANGAADGDDEAHALTVDANGNVYVTGESFNGTWFDHMTIRYSAAGVEQWRHASSNKDDDAAAYAIALLPGNGIYIAGDAVGQTSPPGIMIEKLVDPVATTNLSSSTNPSASGQSVTFTARVAGNAPAGTVDFRDGVTKLCTAVPITRNKLTGIRAATCSTSALTIGSHSVTASYLGDSNNAGSVSLPLTQVVSPPPPGVSLTSSLNPSKPGDSVTFTANVTGQTPTGTVTFKNGTSALCSAVPLQGGGNAPVATCTTAALTKGLHSITAAYSGDANNAAATSPVLTQSVKRPRR